MYFKYGFNRIGDKMTFYELEKLCKAKKRKFYIILILAVIAFLMIIFFYMILNTKNIRKRNEIIETNKTKKTMQVKKYKKNKTSNTLKFVLPDIEINSSIKKKKEVQKNKIAKFLPILEIPKKTETKQKNISLKKETNNTKNIILVTNTIPSFETCINLAKKYLNEEDYQNALKWAKYANIQNKKSPSSWIISAKALYAMGKQKEALKLLKVYNSYYPNKTIQKLIKEFNEK